MITYYGSANTLSVINGQAKGSEVSVLVKYMYFYFKV